MMMIEEKIELMKQQLCVICKVGRNNPMLPEMERLNFMKPFLDEKGLIKPECLDSIDGKYSIREITARSIQSEQYERPVGV